MKVHLMFPDRDFDLEAELPENAPTLTQDLGLDIVFTAMATGDRFLGELAPKAFFATVDDVEVIRYRQGVLADCLEHPDSIRRLYTLAVEAIEAERKVWGYASRFADSSLRRSVDVLGVFVPALKRLRALSAEVRPGVRSEGLTRLLDEIAAELGDEYVASVDAHLRRLRFDDGVTLSAELGTANRGTHYILRRRVRPRTWRERIGLQEPDTYAWHLPERDEAGADALRDLRGRGIALAADALGRSTDHIVSYFRQLRAELGFYIGCLNLRDSLARKGEPICLPEPRASGQPILEARGLYDIALSLSLGGRAVGNELAADGMSLLVVTGANRGGKSTFLRSLGLAQLMMQAGMFVGADAFTADVRAGVFTHFKREEDATLQSGKLDEELGRMSWIVDRVKPSSLVLLNESFASTNEREGSEIGRQIVHALLEAGVKVGYVTHMFHLADGFRREDRPDAQYLRAERLPDGRRTFRVVEGEPLPTSHGVDVYRSIFGSDPSDPQTGASLAAS
jgi:DNA mismatch repair ATPase MutS